MKRDLMAAGLVAILTTVPMGIASAADEKPGDFVPPSATGSRQTSPPSDPASAIGNRKFGSDESGMTRNGASINGQDLSTEELWDQTVYDAKNGEVGTVIAVTESAGEGRKAIVEIGSVLGFGGKPVAVPVERLQMQSDGRLVIGLTEEELEQLPEVRPEKLSAIVR